MNDNSAPIFVAWRWSLELLSFCSCFRKSIEAEIYESMCDKGVGCTKFCTKSANNAGWVIVKSGYSFVIRVLGLGNFMLCMNIFAGMSV